MATELYDTAVLMEQVLNRIEVCLQKIAKDLKTVKFLSGLRSDMIQLLDHVFLLADTDTKVKLLALQTKRNIGGRLDFESAEAQAAQWIGNKEMSIETKSQIATTVGESMGRAVEVELQQARAAREIYDKFNKMLLNIYNPVARSLEVPKGGFQLSSISSLFDKMWDNTKQLEVASTDAKFLATCMLTDRTLAHHVAGLQLCSEDIDWLCKWVPELAEKLQRIEKDDLMSKRMLKGAEMEERHFASYIRRWERVRKRNSTICFDDSTTLNSMIFTHYMPGHHPLFADLTKALQIFSIKITELVDFHWPLEVYGMIAARDDVDHRRNILFLRSRDNCQHLSEEDFLHLTGPSRAIMSTDSVHIEIQLKVKRTMKSEDKSLITEAFACDGDDADSFITHSIEGCFCTIELCCQNFRNSIQATVLSVCVMGGVMEGPLPCANCFEVICHSLPKDAEGKAEQTTNSIILLDRKDGAVPDEEGYLDLSRQVIPVALKGNLVLVIKTGSMSGRVVFKPELSNISQEQFFLGDYKVEINVAWSVLVESELDVQMSSYTKPNMVPATLPFMKLVEDTKGGSC